MKKKLLLSSLFLFLCVNAFGATQLKKTVCPSGCDYTSLESCMNANEQNLVTADQYFDVEISGDWSGGADTTIVTIHNYTTDATRYINIYTTGDARHDGTVGGNANAYVITKTTHSGSIISVTTDNTYLTIDGIIFKAFKTNWQDTTTGISITALQKAVIKNNIFYVYNEVYSYARNGVGIIIGGITSGGSPFVYIYNNIIYGYQPVGSGYAGVGISCNQAGGSHYVYNNTVYDCNSGIIGRSDATIEYKNNIVNGVTSTNYSGADTSSNNIDEDGSGEITSTLTFANAGSYDLHLSSSDTDAIDAGTDLSATFTTDIDGDTRSGTWDIGADEYVSTGSTNVPQIF